MSKLYLFLAPSNGLVRDPCAPLPNKWRRHVSSSKPLAWAQRILNLFFVFAAFLFYDSMNLIQHAKEHYISEIFKRLHYPMGTTNFAAHKYYAQSTYTSRASSVFTRDYQHPLLLRAARSDSSAGRNPVERIKGRIAQLEGKLEKPSSRRRLMERPISRYLCCLVRQSQSYHVLQNTWTQNLFYLSIFTIV